jgi:hypothetical protein
MTIFRSEDKNQALLKFQAHLIFLSKDIGYPSLPREQNAVGGLPQQDN